MSIKKILLVIVIAVFGLIGILMGENLIFDNFDSGELGTGEIVEAIEVIDGDTIKVKNLESGEIFKVRYLGIDTPELTGPSYETCFADEAAERNRELVLDKKLFLEFDMDKYDRFGRILAYVYAEDGTFVNLELIKEGFARFYLDDFNNSYQDEFLEAAMNAQENYLGLWGVCGEFQFGGNCIIKGNISTNNEDDFGNYYSKFYHLPGDTYYERTIVNLDKEDKWLCTIEEAEANGFKRAK